MADQNDWRSETFRRKVIQQIDEAVRQSATSMTKSSVEMENHVFMKAKSREEYLALVARLILHVKEIKHRRHERKRLAEGEPTRKSAKVVTASTRDAEGEPTRKSAKVSTASTRDASTNTEGFAMSLPSLPPIPGTASELEEYINLCDEPMRQIGLLQDDVIKKMEEMCTSEEEKENVKRIKLELANKRRRIDMIAEKGEQ